jgi:hypothetical protein
LQEELVYYKDLQIVLKSQFLAAEDDWQVNGKVCECVEFREGPLIELALVPDRDGGVIAWIMYVHESGNS